MSYIYPADIRITRHARRRFKERTGLPIRAVKAAAANAIERGEKLEDLPFFQRTRLQTLAAKHSPNTETDIRVFNGVAFVFRVGCIAMDGRYQTDVAVLVTVLPNYGSDQYAENAHE